MPKPRQGEIMTDELNQVQENDTEAGIFDDFVNEDYGTQTEVIETLDSKENAIDTGSNVGENPQVEETELNDTNVDDKAPVFKLPIRYNGEDIELNEEEARTLAQKGKNYDRLQEKYNSLNTRLERLAKLNGVSIDEYITKMDKAQIGFMAKDLMPGLKAKYPNDSDEVLYELAKAQMTEQLDMQDRETARQQKTQDDELDAEVQRQIGIFKNEFPGVDPKSLDKQVLVFIKQGMDLTGAYYKYLKIQDDKNRPVQQAREKIVQKNEENKNRSIGSTTNAGTSDQDDFLSGFLNG